MGRKRNKNRRIKKLMKIVGELPPERRPVQQVSNKFHKNKKRYDRKRDKKNHEKF